MSAVESFLQGFELLKAEGRKRLTGRNGDQGAAESVRRVHEMTMNRGLPPHIGFFMGWADGFRPSLLDLMNEPGSTTSDGQSIRETTSGGRWLLKNAVACSGCEKTALKNPSCVCAAGNGVSVQILRKVC